MDDHGYGALPFDVWLAELGKLALTCAYLPAEHEERAVRRAFHLFELSPPIVRRLSVDSAEESCIEDYLERGEAEQAARLFIGGRTAITLKPADAPLRHTATVSLDGGLSAACEANSPALAVVCAWARLFRKTPGAAARPE